MDNEIIKKNFAAARRAQGLTWQEIADRAGVANYQTILNRMNGAGITLATLERLAGLVNLEPWQLLKPSEDIQPDDQTKGTDKAPKLKTGQKAVLNCPLCGSRINVYLMKRDETAGTKNDGQK